MKVKEMELGEAKVKSDISMLWDKSHTKLIILKYSFEELEQLIQEAINGN